MAQIHTLCQHLKRDNMNLASVLAVLGPSYRQLGCRNSAYAGAKQLPVIKPRRGMRTGSKLHYFSLREQTRLRDFWHSR